MHVVVESEGEDEEKRKVGGNVLAMAPMIPYLGRHRGSKYVKHSFLSTIKTRFLSKAL